VRPRRAGPEDGSSTRPGRIRHPNVPCSRQLQSVDAWRAVTVRPSYCAFPPHPDGRCLRMANVDLPSKCIGPIVFVTHVAADPPGVGSPRHRSLTAASVGGGGGGGGCAAEAAHPTAAFPPPGLLRRKNHKKEKKKKNNHTKRKKKKNLGSVETRTVAPKTCSSRQAAQSYEHSWSQVGRNGWQPVATGPRGRAA